MGFSLSGEKKTKTMTCKLNVFYINVFLKYIKKVLTCSSDKKTNLTLTSVLPWLNNDQCEVNNPIALNIDLLVRNGGVINEVHN